METQMILVERKFVINWFQLVPVNWCVTLSPLIRAQQDN